MFVRVIPPRRISFLGLDSPGQSGSGLVLAQGVVASPEPGGSTSSPYLVGAIVVGVAALIGVGIWMWNKDQTRLAEMTPEARHQENMDRLATGATYSLISAVSDR